MLSVGGFKCLEGKEIVEAQVIGQTEPWNPQSVPIILHRTLQIALRCESPTMWKPV